jgi:hypothetical protein
MPGHDQSLIQCLLEKALAMNNDGPRAVTTACLIDRAKRGKLQGSIRNTRPTGSGAMANG